MLSDFSEKEIAIFNGLFELIKQGCNPYSIKVSDMAKAANVGKGTIYEYFDSKQEAISKAILFNISKEIESSFNRIKSKTCFKEKFDETLNIIAENTNNNLSIFNTLFSSNGLNDFYKYLIDEDHYFYTCTSTIDLMLEHLLDVGYKEGIINSKENKYYQNIALLSSIGSFSMYVSYHRIYKDISIDEAKEISYKLLINALN